MCGCNPWPTASTSSSPAADQSDRRRQLVEVSAAGLELRDGDRAERDAWLHATMHDNLTPLEVDLLMLVAPVLRKLANAGAAP
jgi:DNA-binding MarR family transcriptional regulator